MSESSITKNYTPAEFAALYGRHPSWGYRRVYCGAVKVLKGSPQMAIPEAEVIRFNSETIRYEKSKKLSAAKPAAPLGNLRS